MPKVFEKKEKDFTIGIWQSTETFAGLSDLCDLNKADLEKWGLFQSEKRKREWLTVRALLSDLFAAKPVPQISYNDFGKPILSNGMGISISHTKEFIAILITSKNFAGIDLECLRERISVLASKFVSDEEAKSIPEINQTEYLHVLWGAKEVLFKIHSQKELDFRSQLFVSPFQYQSEGIISASINKDNFSKAYRINYQLWQGMMLAYSIAD
ncbi:MAG: hypothetical protein KA444_06255 [Bacteroidia bacterium]|nr:hypothetical protein [Bacteroidia bacterium]